jgi:hypothetical protein
MDRFTGLNRALIRLGGVVAVWCMLAGSASAGVQDSVFFVSPDGHNVAFDVRDVPRREVLNRLLTSRAIALEWVDQTFADERISGAFHGNIDAVLQRLLAQADFVAVYDRAGGTPRITRLTIVGKAASTSKSAGLQGTTLPAQGPKAGPIKITPPTPADLATPLYIPVPAGTIPPPLVAPLAADKSLPLLVPQVPGEKGVPLLGPHLNR